MTVNIWFSLASGLIKMKRVVLGVDLVSSLEFRETDYFRNIVAVLVFLTTTGFIPS